MRFHFSRKNWYIVSLSTITALVLMVFCYLVTNLGYSIAGEGSWVSKTNNNINKLRKKEGPSIPDSVLLVNISYDKELIPINDADGFPMGKIDVTDRDALFKFLNILYQRDDYRFIFLDVFFEEGFDSPNDDNLFPLISKMKNVVISRHRDAVLGHKDLLWSHSFISDYTVTKSSKSFMKYELLPENDKSVVLHMYNVMTGHDIKHNGYFYNDGGKMCNSTIFAKQIINFKGPYDANGNKNYYNLSEDLLVDEEDLLTTPLLKDKYIFIGSMELNDIHGTSEGSLPGVVISANTFLSVMQGQHIIPPVMIVVFFVVLFCISYQVYSGKTIAKWFRSFVEKHRLNINSHVFSYLLSWVSYMSILSISCLVSYYIYGVIYDIFFTATIFQNIDFIVSNREKIKNNKYNTFKDFLLGLIFK